MRRLRLGLGLAGGGLLALAAPAGAQYPGQPPFQPGTTYYNPRPTVSPYLNLVPRNALPGANYYNLVRPFFIPPPPPVQMQGAALLPMEPPPALDLQDPIGRMPRATGHATAFMAYQNFFNTSGTIGAAPRGGAARPASPMRR
jgi:hypothetical protein